MKLPLRTFLAGLLFLVPCLHGAAQTSTARITGTVTDTSGAVVRSATVIAHNEQTGEDRTTVSSDGGTFVFFSLSPAQYTLHASATGFGNIELSKLTLKVGQEFVWTPALSVAVDNSTVTVNGDDSAELDTSSARIGGKAARERDDPGGVRTWRVVQ